MTLPLPEVPRTPAQDLLASGASEVHLISQAEKGGAPSLAIAGPTRKQPLMALFHCMVRYGSARLSTERYGSVRVGLRFHCSLVPL